MANSKNHKFVDIYKEFEDKVIFKNSKESILDLKAAISGHITDYFDKYIIEEITYNTVEDYKSFLFKLLNILLLSIPITC